MQAILQQQRPPRKATTGRKCGSRNRGYFYRSGRGWYVSVDGGMQPLRDEHGHHLKDKATDPEVLKECHARWVLAQPDEPTGHDPDRTPLGDICRLYLADVAAKCKIGQASKATYDSRANFLFNFCSGLPARYRDGRGTKVEKARDRIHQGYGALAVGDLTPIHIDQWLAAHPTWKARRNPVKSIQRAINYCKKGGLITRNPIYGIKVQKSRHRVTYFTPKQEKAMYDNAKTALCEAIYVLIRTGARYGCEFCALTPKHVEFVTRDGQLEGMTWTFSPEESKTGRQRIIRIRDARVIALVKRQMARRPKGTLFCNSQGTPWTDRALRSAFNCLKKRLKKRGVTLDADACLYSTRHTFARRTLHGYWSGRPCTIEALAELMGNTRQVAWEHYAHWCDAYQQPLWDAI